MKSKDPEVVKLQKKIELYNMSIDDEPTDPKAYNLKADALAKIGQITKESSWNEEALKCYNKAIELDPENPLYFAGRSKLYAEMGRSEPAIKDIEQVENLPQNSNVMTSIYLKQTVENIAKLDAVQATLKKLQSEGKIDSELANALAEHAKVTASLVVQVGSHGEKLDVHDQRIDSIDTRMEKFEEIMRVLCEGGEVNKEQITKLIKDTCTLREELAGLMSLDHSEGSYHYS